jgi:cell division protein FtsQ
MPKVKQRQPEPEVYAPRTQVSSVIFGIVMVIAIIVAGAALLGGSLSKAAQRWGGAMDSVSRTMGLSVDYVEVRGLENAPPVVQRQIKMAAMIAPGENMFRADPHVIKSRIEGTRLVANVRVYRHWPDTVMIYADPAQPSALWYDGDKWAVVDSLGRLMGAVKATDHAALVKSVGVGAPEAMPALKTALAHMPHLERQVSVARRVASRRWDLELNTGAIVRLPADEDLGEGLKSLARMEAATDLTRRSLAAIDLRVIGKVFLTPSQSAQSVEEAA